MHHHYIFTKRYNHPNMLKSDCEITWLEEVNIINIFKIIIIAVILITIISIIYINIFMIIIILITVISIILLREHTRVVAKSREAEEKAAKLEEELREVKTIIIIITTYINSITIIVTIIVTINTIVITTIIIINFNIFRLGMLPSFLSSVCLSLKVGRAEKGRLSLLER